MSKLKLFALSVLLTTGGLLAVIYVKRANPADSRAPVLVRVAEDLFITSQVTPGNVRFLRRRGVITLVDIRPDGEADDQASSSEMELASKRNGIDFFYIPVPHENIPDHAVDALRVVLSHQAKPAVLYCRSGRRAARTFALAEASRADGPSCDAIIEMVRASGFAADDLRDNINQRISQRSEPQTENTDDRGPSSH